ncbi:hypothetical protein Plhal703r1_c61g0165451 [Plasmopara halstedii]
MFPNFKSLRDRKNKLKKLADENLKDLQIENIKNDKYKLAQWATDLNKTIDISGLTKTKKQYFLRRLEYKQHQQRQQPDYKLHQQ